MVLEHIKDQIISGELTPGSRLPTEIEIGDHLGISRTPVREAIKIFEAMGVLDVRIGSGTFVNPSLEPSLAQLLLFKMYLQQSTPQKMMELRRVMARGAAELAAGEHPVSAEIRPAVCSARRVERICHFERAAVEFDRDVVRAGRLLDPALSH